MEQQQNTENNNIDKNQSQNNRDNNNQSGSKVVTYTLQELEKRRKYLLKGSSRQQKNTKKPQKHQKNQIKRDRKKLKKQIDQQFRGEKSEKNEDDQHEEHNEENMNRIEQRKKKKQQYIEEMKTAPRVVVDFQFVDQTWERDRASLMKQIEVCHNENQKFEKPLKLTCSRSDHEQMQKHMQMRNVDKWGIDLEPRDILDAYKKEDIIYMSGDVDVDMAEYEPDKIYIIGGLVEHNRLVNLTKNYCEKNGITARRLPLTRYLDLKACSLLNINHVFSILLKLHNGWTWEKAVSTSVPQRKIGFKYFDSDEEENQKNQDEDQDENIEKIEKKVKQDETQN